MPYGLLIGAAVGLAKNQLVDVPREKKQRELAAATQRYSPWTHLQAQPIQQQDPFGNALQFGAAGASMKSGWETASALQNYLNSNKSNINTTQGQINAGGPDATDLQDNPAPGDADKTRKVASDDLSTTSVANPREAMQSVQDNYKAGDLAGVPGSSDSQTWVTRDGNEVIPGTTYNNGMSWFPDPATAADSGQPGFFGKGPRSIYGSNPWG